MHCLKKSKTKIEQNRKARGTAFYKKYKCFILSVCACVCVCVYQKKKHREKGREREGVNKHIHDPSRTGLTTSCDLSSLCARKTNTGYFQEQDKFLSTRLSHQSQYW